jgi:hypothetical protein
MIRALTSLSDLLTSSPLSIQQQQQESAAVPGSDGGVGGALDALAAGRAKGAGGEGVAGYVARLDLEKEQMKDEVGCVIVVFDARPEGNGVGICARW